MAVACVPRLWPHRSPSWVGVCELDPSLIYIPSSPGAQSSVLAPSLLAGACVHIEDTWLGTSRSVCRLRLPISCPLFLPGGSSPAFPGDRFVTHRCSACCSLLPRCPACCPLCFSLAFCPTCWFSLTSHLRPPGLPAAVSPATRSRCHSPAHSVLSQFPTGSWCPWDEPCWSLHVLPPPPEATSCEPSLV